MDKLDINELSEFIFHTSGNVRKIAPQNREFSRKTPFDSATKTVQPNSIMRIVVSGVQQQFKLKPQHYHGVS